MIGLSLLFVHGITVAFRALSNEGDSERRGLIGLLLLETFFN